MNAVEQSKTPVLQKNEFNWIRDYLYKKAGIVLNESKQAMVMGRLEKRLRYLGLNNYQAYFRLFDSPGFENETTMAIDLLTTNETYFFREPKHFDFLKAEILPQYHSKPMRIWSAASSSGEEAYTLAMLLADYNQTGNWEVLGTDISTRILDKARSGLYQATAAEKIPNKLLKNYCLRGIGEYEGFLLIDPALRKHVKFLHANLIEKLPDLGLFDVVFLRNVMIYFDMETKQRLLERLTNYLRPGAYLFISHSETLNSIKTDLRSVMPSIYRKPPA